MRWVSGLFNANGSPVWLPLFVLLVASVFQVALTFTAAWIDETLFLPDEGDGFLEHYGMWALLATDPLILMAVGYSYRMYDRAIRELPLNLNMKRAAAFRDRIAKPFREVIGMRGRYKFIYIALLLVGGFSWTNNFFQTTDPISIYGNDVFDAWTYKWGYFANKLNLFTSWVVIYPLAGYLLLSMSLSLRALLSRLVENGLIQPRLTYPDRCFGCAKLGLLNAALLVPYVLAYLVVFSLLLTHETSYFSVVVPLIVLTIVVIVASVAIIGPVTDLVKRAYDAEEQKLADFSDSYPVDDDKQNRTFEFERLCFNDATPSPYGRFAGTAINLFRVIPAALTLLKLAR